MVLRFACVFTVQFMVYQKNAIDGRSNNSLSADGATPSKKHMPVTVTTASALGYSAASLVAAAFILFVVTLCIWPFSRNGVSSTALTFADRKARATTKKVGVSACVLAAASVILFIVSVVLASKIPPAAPSSSSSNRDAGNGGSQGDSGNSVTSPNILPVLAAGDGLESTLPLHGAPATTAQPILAQLPIISTASDTTSEKVSDKLSWRDQSPVSPGALEAVVEFDEQDAPVSIHGAPVTLRDAHMPKAVPALPRRYPRFYQPAFETAAAPVQFTPNSQADATHAQAAIYYAPPQAYPTLNDLMLERAQFENRPDTIELQRHRRVTELRDAAISLDPTVQRDGLVVPLHMVLNATQPNEF